MSTKTDFRTAGLSTIAVIPAKAGIHEVVTPLQFQNGFCGNILWIPAFAGMMEEKAQNELINRMCAKKSRGTK